jgi:hypothetical protein
MYRNTKAGYTIISTGIVHYIASMDCSVGPRVKLYLKYKLLLSSVFLHFLNICHHKIFHTSKRNARNVAVLPQ